MTDQTIGEKSIAYGTAYRLPDETWGEKIIRKFKANPWVPIGALVTTYALFGAARSLRARDSQRMQYWMRARVVAQALTIFALVMGAGTYTQRNVNKHNREQELFIQKMEEEARARREFEVRLKEAEEMTAVEEALAKANASHTSGSGSGWDGGWWPSPSGASSSTGGSWTRHLGFGKPEPGRPPVDKTA